MSGQAPRGGILGRSLLALLFVTVAKAAAAGLDGIPVLSLLAVTSVGFFAAGALFGWIGVGAAVATQAAFTLYYYGLAPGPWAGLVPYTLTGALAWLVFRHAPGVGRAFPNGASLKWFVLAGVGAGLLSSSLISLVSGHWVEAVTVWARSTVVSLWLLTPPLLILGRVFMPRWLAPIPGEATRSLPWRLALVAEPPVGGWPDGREAGAVPVRTSRVAVSCLLASVLVMAGTVAIGWGPALLWWNLLYLAPILWAAIRLGLPGGLVAAGAAGLLSLIAHAVLLEGTEVPSGVPVGIYGQVLLFWIFGALLGLAAQREAELVDGLVAFNARLRRDLQWVVQALTGALEAKDGYTEGHLQRVSGYALEVGRRLGLDPRELELLQIASTLHDVGKIGIPETILNKRDKLDEEEWEVMRRHPEIGARLLSSLDGLREAAPLVLHHQERWDGSTDGRFPGYPAGLAGEEIPLGARIIAVVDAFDAMTTDRPYRRALPEKEARQVLVAERGAQFDPRVADTFLAILDQDPWGSTDTTST